MDPKKEKILLDRYNSGELSREQFAQEYFKTLEARPRFEKILNELQNTLKWGQKYLRIWQRGYEAMHGDDQDLIELASQYFLINMAAQLQGATLQAAKLVENHPDSVNLHYFFNILLNESRKDFPNNWKEVKKSVESDRLQIQNFQTIVSKIKEERDKQLAHLDRSIINSSINELTYVEVAELDKLFQAIKQMLDKYYTFYYGEPPAELIMTEDLLAHFGPEWLEDLFYLARKALDDDTIEDVSDHVKRIRIWRKNRLSVEKFFNENHGTGLIT